MPAESQSQARLMNWVHAVQKGEAKGSGKVNEIAKEMKPSDTEHFMNRGHIDKSLPEHVKSSEFRDYLRAIKRKKEVNPIFSRDIDPYTSEDVYNFRDIASEAETYKERLHAHKDASKLKQPGISITTQRTTPRAQEMASKAIEELKAKGLWKESNVVGDLGAVRENTEPVTAEPIPLKDRVMNTHKVRKMQNLKKAEDAFAVGFVKAAVDLGVEPLTAMQMLRIATQSNL